MSGHEEKKRHRRRPTIEEVREHFRTTPLNSKEKSARELIFMDIIFDVSGSMCDYYTELVSCFKEILLPGLKEASRVNVAAMRLGCVLFSSSIALPWDGFKSLDEVQANPLSMHHLQQDGLRNQTALYKAIIKGVRGTTMNARIAMEKNCISMPLRKIMILTDGANNLAPFDTESVLQEIQGAEFSLDEKQDQVSLAYFKTRQGLSENEFQQIARRIGINDFYTADLTGTGSKNDLETRKSLFREHFEIFSSRKF